MSVCVCALRVRFVCSFCVSVACDLRALLVVFRPTANALILLFYLILLLHHYYIANYRFIPVLRFVHSSRSYHTYSTLHILLTASECALALCRLFVCEHIMPWMLNLLFVVRYMLCSRPRKRPLFLLCFCVRYIWNKRWCGCSAQQTSTTTSSRLINTHHYQYSIFWLQNPLTHLPACWKAETVTPKLYLSL